MRVKEDTREEMLRAHKREIESRDYLIQLVKEKVGCLQQQLERPTHVKFRRPDKRGARHRPQSGSPSVSCFSLHSASTDNDKTE